jgi:hypothetical protein
MVLMLEGLDYLLQRVVFILYNGQLNYIVGSDTVFNHSSLAVCAAWRQIGTDDVHEMRHAASTVPIAVDLPQNTLTLVRAARCIMVLASNHSAGASTAKWAGWLQVCTPSEPQCAALPGKANASVSDFRPDHK